MDASMRRIEVAGATMYEKLLLCLFGTTNTQGRQGLAMVHQLFTFSIKILFCIYFNIAAIQTFSETRSYFYTKYLMDTLVKNQWNSGGIPKDFTDIAAWSDYHEWCALQVKQPAMLSSSGVYYNETGM